MGKYPEEAVAMLASIAAATEARRPRALRQDVWALDRPSLLPPATEAAARVVEHALETVPCAALFVPTRSGASARLLSRFNPAVWIVALSPDRAACQGLAFSYGVHPLEAAEPEDWKGWARRWLRENGIEGRIAMLAAGPSERNPEANHRIEFMKVG